MTAPVAEKVTMIERGAALRPWAIGARISRPAKSALDAMRHRALERSRLNSLGPGRSAERVSVAGRPESLRPRVDTTLDISVGA